MKTIRRKVYFSFHHERDIWRANQVRNCWITHGKSPQFIDAADWEKVKRGGRAAIRKWIDSQMDGTSVTCVLIGQETADREWVLYEIEQSLKLGRGLLGIYIHQLKNKHRETDLIRGANPFSEFQLLPESLIEHILPRTADSIIDVYDWHEDEGRQNIGRWIEDAYRDARARRRAD